MRVKVYVEGGSPGKLENECRRGFSEFFKRAGLEGHMPRVIACGGRNRAWDRFCAALRLGEPETISLLLVDSEARVLSERRPLQHLRSRDCWVRPEGARDEQVHLMVQCMESWFLADVSALESFFGAGFKSASLSRRGDIENIPKGDVFDQLTLASRKSRKGTYHKGSHSFEILANIDPAKVVHCSPFAKRLVEALKEHLIPI